MSEPFNPPDHCPAPSLCESKTECVHKCGYLWAGRKKDQDDATPHKPARASSAPGSGWAPTMKQVQDAANHDHAVAVAAFLLHRLDNPDPDNGERGVTVNDCVKVLQTPNFRSRMPSLNQRFPGVFYWQNESNDRAVGGQKRAHRRHFIFPKYRGEVEEYVRDQFRKFGFLS